jgi:hypothetical protein
VESPGEEECSAHCRLIQESEAALVSDTLECVPFSRTSTTWTIRGFVCVSSVGHVPVLIIYAVCVSHSAISH